MGERSPRVDAHTTDVPVIARGGQSDPVLQGLLESRVDGLRGGEIARSAITVQADRDFSPVEDFDVGMRVDQPVAKLGYISAQLSRAVAHDAA